MDRKKIKQKNLEVSLNFFSSILIRSHNIHSSLFLYLSLLSLTFILFLPTITLLTLLLLLPFRNIRLVSFRKITWHDCLSDRNLLPTKTLEYANYLTKVRILTNVNTYKGRVPRNCGINDVYIDLWSACCQQRACYNRLLTTIINDLSVSI